MRAVLVAVALGACASPGALQATALQPHPRRARLAPGELPRSEKLYIFEPTSIGYVRVQSSAELVAVTRDRLRVHLAVNHPSDEPHAVWLEDETGRRYQPVREAARRERMVHPQWRIPRDPRCPFDCAVWYHDIWLDYGTADYVVDVPGIIGPERRSLVLHVARPGIFRPLIFSWTFGEGRDIRHFGEEGSFIDLPRYDTMVRSSEAVADTFRYLD